MEVDREQWLKERKKGLGGTDMARVLGVSRYYDDPVEGRDTLWGEKLGYVAGMEQTGRMTRGLQLEALIIEIYAQESGRHCIPGGGLTRHPDYPWMIANADGKQSDIDKPDRGILEIKSFDQFAYDDFMIYGPNDGFVIQVQQYMAVHGLAWASIVGHDCVNWTVTWYDLERDDWIIDLMYRKGAEFWDYVKNKQRPPSEVEPVIIESVKPKIITMYSEDWSAASEKYLEAKGIAVAAKNLLDEAQKELIDEMDGKSGAEGFGLRCYYKEEKGRTSFDKIGFQADNPDIDLDNYKKEGPPKYVFRAYDRRKSNDRG